MTQHRPSPPETARGATERAEVVSGHSPWLTKAEAASYLRVRYNAVVGSSDTISDTMLCGPAGARPTVLGRLHGGSSSMCQDADCSETAWTKGYCRRHRWRYYRSADHAGGRRRRTTLAERYWSKVIKHAAGCWGWSGPTVKGYGAVMGDDWKKRYAHRVSWELHFGVIPEGLFVCHRCDNPPCTRPDHLFLGTQTDNMRDAARKNRIVLPSRWARRAA